MQLTDRTSLRLVDASPGAGAGAHRCARPDEARKLSYPITLESGRAVHWRTVSEPEQARTPLKHYGEQSEITWLVLLQYVRNRWQQGTGHGVREGCVHVVVMHARLSDSEASAGQDNTSRAGFASLPTDDTSLTFPGAWRIDVRVRAQQNTVQYSPRSTCTSVLVHRGELNYYNDP